MKLRVPSELVVLLWLLTYFPFMALVTTANTWAHYWLTGRVWL